MMLLTQRLAKCAANVLTSVLIDIKNVCITAYAHNVNATVSMKYNKQNEYLRSFKHIWTRLHTMSRYTIGLFNFNRLYMFTTVVI